MTDSNSNEKNAQKTSEPKDPASIIDPHHQREAENYSKPIPSREFLLAHLDQRHGPATHLELVEELQFTDPDNIEALRRRLIAMARDGQLICNRSDQFLPTTKVNLKKGVVIGHRDGFGFVKCLAIGDDAADQSPFKGLFGGKLLG